MSFSARLLPVWAPPSWLLLLAVLLPVSGLAQTAERERRLTFQDRLDLIKKNPESPYGASSLAAFEKQLRRTLSAEERQAFGRTDAGKWKVFEDDVIRFELPDDPLLSVEVVSPQEKPIRVVGGVASMADNSFERAYHLKVGKELHYGVILVREAAWFDDGICLCGPVVYKKCMVEDGTALEFSLLPCGNIKKVQALGEKQRAMLFEWTHSAIPQSAYARLGRSVRLKQRSPHTLEQWHAEARIRNEEPGLIPWLERGDDAQTVQAILGEPARRDAGGWTYVRDTWEPDGAGERLTLCIKMDDQGYGGLDEHSNRETLPPKEGTVAWAEASVKAAEDDAVPEAQKTRITQEDFPQISRLFLKAAPVAQGDEWDRWSEIACSLTRQGWRDPQIPQVVLKRYRENDLGHFYSNEILNDYEVEDRERLFQARVRHLLAMKKEIHGGETNNLLAMLDPKAAATQESVRLALKHPNAAIRSSATSFADRLPEKEALAMLKRALSDKDDHVRTMAAYALRPLAQKEDLPWLEKRRQQEKDDDVKRALEQTLEAARARIDAP